MLKEVAVRAAEQMKANPPNIPVNGKTIKTQIVAQKTNVEPEGVVDIVNYVQKWGGGREMFYVKVLHRFHRILGKPKRRVHPDFFGCLAAQKLSAEHMAPHLVTAIVMQQAFCPEGAVKEKVCRFITVSDVNTLFKKHRSS